MLCDVLLGSGTVREHYRQERTDGEADGEGVDPGASEALKDMTTSNDAPPPDVLDELVTRLLDCGGVLSQIISSMVEFQSSGRSAPETAPIPEVAHSLIRSVIEDVGNRYSKRDLKVSARIVREVTEVMCSDLYVLGPELN
jgi:hypothetical protein